MEQAILVYVDLDGMPVKVGQLWGHYRHGRESMSFEYDRHSFSFCYECFSSKRQ